MNLFLGHGSPMNAIITVQYPTPGNRELAKQIIDLLHPKNVHLDAEPGIDHDAWSVLQAMYPAPDIPVLQLSLNRTQNTQSHYDLA